MPIVRAQREVSLAPVPGVRRTAAATPTSEGAGVEVAKGQLGRAMGGLGDIGIALGVQRFTEMQRQEREKANQIATLGMDNAFAKWEHDRLYNSETGALTRQGKNALGLPEEIQAEFTKIAGEIEQTATTPEQKIAFQRIKSQRGQSLDLTIQRHVFGEIQAYGREELASTIANGQSEAVAKALDPVGSEQALRRTVEAIRTTGPTLGYGPEAIEKHVAAATSAVREGVIERLLNADKDQAAATYFEAARDAGQLSGESLSKMEKAIEAGTLRGDSQRKADEIVAAGGTFAEQMAQVRAISDPKLRDAVRERVEHDKTLKDREDRETERVVMQGAYDILDKTANVNKIPATQWASFDGGTRSAMRSYAEHIAKGVPIQTDLPTYYGLMQRAMDEAAGATPAQGQTPFSTTNLLRYRAQLDDVEFKQLASIQLSMINGKAGQAAKDLGGFRTNLQIVNDSLAQYGITADGPKQTKQEAEAVARLRRMLDTSVAIEAQRIGKAPDNVFIQREADRILSQSTTTPGSWWNFWPGGKSVSDTTTRLIDTKVEDMPPTERKQVEDALRAAQRPITDATVMDLWLKTKLRVGGR